MSNKNADRLTYLAEKFDVFECDNEEVIDKKIASLKDNNFICTEIKSHTSDNILAIISTKVKDEKKATQFITNISVSFDVFTNIIKADPTVNKSCVQWMLNTFTRLLKSGGASINAAIRFVDEDLPEANSYISIFEANKRKIKFKALCSSSYILRNIKDPTDINQYKSLSQLFDAVDPFIERTASSEIERILYKFVESNQAIIPIRDRKFTLYIPLTLHASTVFSNFASWCTARAGNGNFATYTDKRKPNGYKSNLYIIINNKFFTNESEEIYQIHFESSQIKDRSNSEYDIYERVLVESDGISNFFQEELLKMAKQVKNTNNVYLDYLLRFGFCDSLFELMESDCPTIEFLNKKIKKLPDVSKFKNIDTLIISDGGLTELHPTIGSLETLEILSLPNNKLRVLPKEIGNLKNLVIMNLINNPIEDIPDEIKYLDRSNGGSLLRVSIKEEHIGSENYLKLKKLLPQTLIGVNNIN